MILYKNYYQPYEKNEDEILQEFCNSRIFLDKYKDEKTKLALFLSMPEPDGLQSFFYGYQFKKLWDYYCANKYKFLEIKNKIYGDDVD